MPSPTTADCGTVAAVCYQAFAAEISRRAHGYHPRYWRQPIAGLCRAGRRGSRGAARQASHAIVAANYPAGLIHLSDSG